MDGTGSEIKLEYPDQVENHEPSTSADNSINTIEDSSDNESEDYVVTLSNPCQPDPDHPFIPPSQREDAPLAGIIKPELEDIDPRRYFPDYQPSGDLRFSRLFAANSKPTLRNQIWWLSKTFNKHPPKSSEAPENELAESSLKLNIDAVPKYEDCMPDDEALLKIPGDRLAKMDEQASGSEDEDDAAPWRFGPAQIWYDRMGVPTNPKKFDYGFKLSKDSKPNKNGALSSDRRQSSLDHNAEIYGANKETEEFLPMDLIHWEDDIIIDSEEARKKASKFLIIDKIVADFSDNSKLPRCGWIPTAHTRSYKSFMAAYKQGAFQQMFSQMSVKPLISTDTESVKVPLESNHSLFPVDSYEFETTQWEDNIIWDADDMPSIPEPRMLTLDYEDDPTIFGMPEDYPTEDKDGNKQELRKGNQFAKKSEMILMQVQQRQKQEEAEHIESTIAQMADKDPFNLSNDDYYNPKSIARSNRGIGGLSNTIQHSIPAQNIHRVFFPTNLTQQAPTKLRQHHRIPLSKQMVKGQTLKPAPVLPLTKHIRMVDEKREQQKLLEGGVDIFPMREIQDLSARDSELLLLEYCEEHPPLLSQPGMASRIKNYYKRKDTKEPDIEMEFGETAFAHTSPLLGNLNPGQCLQAVENNMYRAPIYKHSDHANDFLLIRTKVGFFLRKCANLFVVGQECPLYEVPKPNSKKAAIFSRDFLMAYIYRMFWDSEDTPRRVKMEDIKETFPHQTESCIRKRLKQCADFKGKGTAIDQNYWVLRDDFRLPSKEDVLNMVTPEMCCAHWSMLAAEQRLRDAGYGDKYFFTPENEDDTDEEAAMEDELKCAPWNTTKAFLAAVKGVCILDQTGIADPTGCGQGFSYVRVSQKAQKEEVPQVPKRVVTGTNADLRKLPLKEAKEICREYGLKEEELNSLSRWDIIHVIRTLSTQAAKARSDFSGMARFARGNIRVNYDLQEKYKQFCQERFELQNQILSNPEEASTDDGSSAGDDSDQDDSSRKLEKSMSSKGKKTIGGVSYSSTSTLTEAEKRKLEFEMEERERLDLQRMIRGEVTESGVKISKGAKEAVARSHDQFFKEGDSQNELPVSNEPALLLTDNTMKKLKVFRTFRGDDGKEWTRVEVISHPQLIEAYVRIRTTKDEDFIKVWAHNDGAFKEERRKEKRRIQDQLRRLKRTEAKVEQRQLGRPKSSHEEEPEPPAEGLIAMEGTRMIISKKLYKHAEHAKKKALRLHIPRHFLETEKKKKPSTDETKRAKKETLQSTSSREEPVTEEELPSSSKVAPPSSGLPPSGLTTPASSVTGPIGGRRRGTLEADYLIGPHKSVQRRRADPRVSMASILHEISNDMLRVQNAEHLVHPVNAKKVPDYYELIKQPMDLQQIRKNISDNKYELRRQFLEDLTLILMNSVTYNGPNHIITHAARHVLDIATIRLSDHEDKLIQLEKVINPLLDDNDMVGFSHILKGIVQECKNLPKSAAFHNPVDGRKVLNYFERIERPMDLGTIEQNVIKHKYTTVADFRRDMEQIYLNSLTYNGPKHPYTIKAAEILEHSDCSLAQHHDNLVELERNIQRALGAAQVDDELASVSGIESISADPIATALMSAGEEAILDSGVGESGAEESGGVLHDDLEMSDEDEEEWEDPASGLLQSQMNQTGMLMGDLAMSESSDDDEGLNSAKRPKLDDLDSSL
ncbi:bromodomain-containing protein [Ditylenchus destructor]|uniref:Bromodomain-containing protein n=1 Tax=Ditylenchus destructor TaxID=166010 RepID=A0AAD4R954_9BILA|nr:bromodomain-containing protein [Ditylenchus destructor]